MTVPPWIYGAAALVSVAVGFGAGWTVRDWKRDSEVLAGIEDATKKLNAARVTVDKAATAYETEKADAAVVTNTRSDTIREIYRDRPISADCAVDPSAARVLNDAVAAANARASGQPAPGLPAATDGSSTPD